MNEIDRQKQLETDSLQNGVLRYCQSREYAQASDDKPVRNLMAEALKPLAEAILQAQLALKAPEVRNCPGYVYESLSQRVSSLERWQSWLKGGWAAIAAMFAWLFRRFAAGRTFRKRRSIHSASNSLTELRKRSCHQSEICRHRSGAWGDQS